MRLFMRWAIGIMLIGLVLIAFAFFLGPAKFREAARSGPLREKVNTSDPQQPQFPAETQGAR